MKKNYLINSIFLTFILIIFTAFKVLGYSSGAMLRQDTIYYILYIPVNLIFLIFGIAYVAFSTKWKKDLKLIWNSILSMIITVILFIVAITLVNIYDTFGSGLQILLFCLLFSLVLINIIYILIKNKSISKLFKKEINKENVKVE